MVVRDTDADWQGISGEPYYGVFSSTDYFRRNLTPERLEHFWATGRADIGWQLALLRSHYGDFQPRTAIDFGCGVGRLLKAIATIVDRAYGVDVADGMREEARRNAPDNIEIVATIADVPEAKVDWINSCIVFQHIHPVNGFALFAELLDRLAPGGGLTLHFGTFKERAAFAGNADYFSWDGNTAKSLVETPFGSGTMMMYDYDLNWIMAMLHLAGVDRFTIQHANHGGHHGAFIIGRKTPD